DEVWVLAQDVLERELERAGVGSDLSLICQAIFVAVKVLDRIFNGHDVFMSLGVDLVDDRGERGGLPGSGGAGDQDQPARSLCKIRDRRRQAELLEVENLEGNGAKRRRHRAALHENVGPKSSQVLDAEGKIELVFFLELVLLRVGEYRVAQGFGLYRSERRHLQRNQLAVDPELGR